MCACMPRKNMGGERHSDMGGERHTGNIGDERRKEKEKWTMGGERQTNQNDSCKISTRRTPVEKSQETNNTTLHGVIKKYIILFSCVPWAANAIQTCAANAYLKSFLKPCSNSALFQEAFKSF